MAKDKHLITDMWHRACMGYNHQEVDPAVLEEFVALVVFRCLRLNREAIIGLQANEEIVLPGAASLLDRARIECRDLIEDYFGLVEGK